MSGRKCEFCGTDPAAGFASVTIGGRTFPYCHPDEGPSCYEQHGMDAIADRYWPLLPDDDAWEYGWEARFEPDGPVAEALEFDTREQAEASIAYMQRDELDGPEHMRRAYRVVRRRPAVAAGPWEPIDKGVHEMCKLHTSVASLDRALSEEVSECERLTNIIVRLMGGVPTGQSAGDVLDRAAASSEPPVTALMRERIAEAMRLHPKHYLNSLRRIGEPWRPGDNMTGREQLWCGNCVEPWPCPTAIALGGEA